MKKDLIAKKLTKHVRQLRDCQLCPQMNPPVVSGGPVVSRVLLVGQAPGDKEPKLGRPFAWTAGRTLFGWFNEAAGMSEDQFRASVYMAAVCRCFPGKKPTGGDRVPSPKEIQNCSVWLKREIEILRPGLIIPVGKLAIEQFLPRRLPQNSNFHPGQGAKRKKTGGVRRYVEDFLESNNAGMDEKGSLGQPSREKLDQMIGRVFSVTLNGSPVDIIPLPHPSGASPWHRKEPGKTLLKKALKHIAKHPAFQKPVASVRPAL